VTLPINRPGNNIKLQLICWLADDDKHQQQLAQYLAVVAENNNRTISKIDFYGVCQPVKIMNTLACYFIYYKFHQKPEKSIFLGNI
jgi:hypothetical protein